MSFRTLKCLRCGWEWATRRERDPTRCAHCKSPLWNKERRSNAEMCSCPACSHQHFRKKRFDAVEVEKTGVLGGGSGE